MFKIIISAVFSVLQSRQRLILENIALRHQLEVLQRNAKRPRLKPSDRMLWALFSRFLPDWRRHLTIVKYMVKPTGPPSQTWNTFIRNHMTEIVAIDLFTVHTATFKTLYVFLVLSLDRRKIIHFNVTTNPNSDWTSMQLLQAFPFNSSPRFLIRDRDGIYGQKVPDTLKTLGVEQVVISPRSPWQNGYCERVIGSIRRECLDHMIVFNGKHLRRVLKEYFAYYHESRTHLGLEKDSPKPRAVQARDVGPVIIKPVLGGLHHRYYRKAA